MGDEQVTFTEMKEIYEAVKMESAAPDKTEDELAAEKVTAEEATAEDALRDKIM